MQDRVQNKVIILAEANVYINMTVTIIYFEMY